MMEGLFQAIGSLFKLLFSTIFLTFRAFTTIFDFFYRRRDLHGSAKWNKGGERRRLISRSKNKNGLIIDGVNRISHEASTRHLILAAPSGSGKSTSFIIPTIFGLGTSFAVTDPSGEIFEATAAAKQREGCKIKKIDVRDLAHSLQFNPLHRANSFTQIMMVTDTLITAANPHQSAESAFWNDGAKQILNVIIRCVKNDKLEFQTLANVRYLLNNFGVDGTAILPYIAKHSDSATMVEWQGVLSSDEKVLLGAVATARTALHKFADPAMCQLTNTETLNFEELRGPEPCGLYIVIPEEEISYYAFFTTILYTQLFDFCLKMPKPDQPYLSIYFLLDEFGNLAPIPSFPSIITTARKRNISISIIVQDLFQVESLYSKTDAQTIINGGCSSRLFFPGLSVETCQMVEKLLGQATIHHKEMWTEKRYEAGRPLMTADEVRRMKSPNEALYLYFNQKPLRLKNVTPFYRNPRLVRLSQLELEPLEYWADLELRYIDLEVYRGVEESGFDFSH